MSERRSSVIVNDAGSQSQPAAAATALSTNPVLPQFRKRFKPKQAESVIHEVLQEKLKGKVYAVDQVTALTKELSEAVKAQLLKELDIPRYKVIVQVVVCEQKGEGVNMGCRCLWDPDSDSMAIGQFSNDTIFCSATAFAIYHS